MSAAEIKQHVTDYLSIDREIRESGKLLSQLRKKRKELGAHVLEWMQKNDKHHIKTRQGEIERFSRNKKETLKRERVEEVASTFITNPAQVTQLCTVLFDERRVIAVEQIKCGKPPKPALTDSVAMDDS
jgi:seryl-tRNA synthetase